MAVDPFRMIITITTPTARLGSDARLLLMIKGSPHAFDERQLVSAVLLANEASKDALCALGSPVPSPFKDRLVFDRPEDPVSLEHFLAAYEWLSYQDLAGSWAGSVWVKAA